MDSLIDITLFETEHIVLIKWTKWYAIQRRLPDDLTTTDPYSDGILWELNIVPSGNLT